MLRSLARKYLPLALATWFSLFLGLSAANAVESHPLGTFGMNGNWTTAVADNGTGGFQCVAMTTNSDDESFGIFLQADGTVSLMLMYNQLIVPHEKTMDMEIHVAGIRWTLEDTSFEPDQAEQETFVMFDFSSREKGIEFLTDLAKADLVTLREPGSSETFSLWFFDGYVEALGAIQQCQTRIRNGVSDEAPRGNTALKPGEQKA